MLIRFPSLLLLLIFIVVPIVEIGLFISVGGWIGIAPTLLCILLTAIAGAALVRRQGLQVLTRIQAETQAGRVPVVELFDGLCLLIAGLLLLTPGFFTDTVGFTLLIPPLRAVIGLAIAQRVRTAGAMGAGRAGGPFRAGLSQGSPFPGGPFDGGPFQTGSAPRGPAATGGGPGGGRVIDAEFEEVDPEMPPRPGPPRDNSR